MARALLLLALSVALAACASRALTLHSADTPVMHKALRISEQDWTEILALVPTEWELRLYGAAHNYKQDWIELWMAKTSAGPKPCGGLVLLFTKGNEAHWHLINEGASWGDCHRNDG